MCIGCHYIFNRQKWHNEINVNSSVGYRGKFRGVEAAYRGIVPRYTAT